MKDQIIDNKNPLKLHLQIFEPNFRERIGAAPRLPQTTANYGAACISKGDLDP
jgi:hypothetical protein